MVVLRVAYLPDYVANGALQSLPDLGRGFFEPRIVDRLHRRHGVNRCDLNITGLTYVARQHGTDLVFQLKGFVRQSWVARAEYPIRSKGNANLLVQRFCTSISLMMPKPSSFRARTVRATASSNAVRSVVLK